MKKLLVLSVLVFCLFSVNSAIAAGGNVGTTTTPTAAAGPPPTLPESLPMVSGSKALMSYAKGRVAQAISCGGSEGNVLPGGTTWVQVSENNPDITVIQNLLAGKTLWFRVLEPEAYHYFSAQLSDSMGYTLFTGSNRFQLEKDAKGNWQIPTGAANVSMDIVEYVPVYIPGASSAYIAQSGFDPNTGQQLQNVYLQVNSDRVFFPTSMAGFPGGLMVVSVGASSGVYSTTTGTPQPTTQITSRVKPSIEGLIPLSNPPEINDDPTSVSGQGKTPLYQVKVSADRMINLYGKTTEGEIAKGVFVRKIGPKEEEQEEFYFSSISGGPLPMQFKVGIYDLYFVYPSFGADDPSLPPMPYPYGGGMG